MRKVKRLLQAVSKNTGHIYLIYALEGIFAVWYNIYL
jgi:hypothetical protein